MKRPFWRRWCWIDTIISYSVFGRYSLPVWFLTSVIIFPRALFSGFFAHLQYITIETVHSMHMFPFVYLCIKYIYGPARLPFSILWNGTFNKVLHVVFWQRLTKHTTAYELCVWWLFAIRCHSYADARRKVVERAFRASCHTHSYVGPCCVCRETLYMHKKYLRMPTYAVRSDHAMYTLCERSVRNVHNTLTLVDAKCVSFTTSPLRVGSEFWTFCQPTVCMFLAYAHRINIDIALVSVFIARSRRM